MVVGVLGEDVVGFVVLGFSQEHALTQHPHMGDLSVLDLQKNVASHDFVL